MQYIHVEYYIQLPTEWNQFSSCSLSGYLLGHIYFYVMLNLIINIVAFVNRVMWPDCGTQYLQLISSSSLPHFSQLLLKSILLCSRLSCPSIVFNNENQVESKTNVSSFFCSERTENQSAMIYYILFSLCRWIQLIRYNSLIQTT